MTKAEEDLIIAEQNQSREIILKAIEKEKCESLGIIQGKNKAIKDLEWQLKQVTEDNDYYQAENERLEKENAELELKIKHITEHLEPQAMTSLFEQVEEEVRQEQMIEELNSQNKALEEQIKTMKSCRSCKHDNHCNHRVCDKSLPFWELRR